MTTQNLIKNEDLFSVLGKLRLNKAEVEAMIEADEYENGVVTLVPLDVGTYAEKYSQKAVRKNCTIPSWLDTFASKNQLSLSEILQNALIGIYKQTNHLD